MDSERRTTGPAERNKVHIVHHLRKYVEEAKKAKEDVDEPVKVLEIASGTGEHAAYFNTEIPGTVMRFRIEICHIWS